MPASRFPVTPLLATALLAGCVNIPGQHLQSGGGAVPDAEVRARIQAFEAESGSDTIVLTIAGTHYGVTRGLYEYEVEDIAHEDAQLCARVVRYRDTASASPGGDNGWTARTPHQRCFEYARLAAVREPGQTMGDNTTDAVTNVTYVALMPLVLPMYLIALGIPGGG